MTYQLSENSQRVFLDRYALRDTDGVLLESSIDQAWRRVADAIARVECRYTGDTETWMEWEDRFYYLLEGFKFVPAGRILSGAGSGREVTYYNCFVIPSPEDSREGILECLKTMTEIMARGGGVGINFSTIRPRGTHIKSVNGTASGPVNWMEIFSVMTGRVIQQGGSRRGALMAMLDDDHPDILEFIEAKRIDPQTGKPMAIEHANVSICISDAFMEAVKNDEEWQTGFPTAANLDRALAAGATYKHGPTYQARFLWEKICERAWATAEPGIVFMDRGSRGANTWYYENIRCVNPCGEQFLPEWGVCNLGHMNLSAYVRKEGQHDPLSGSFDYVALRKDVATAMRFLDNVIDASPYFLEENERQQKGTRRTGLGTMGLADTLIKLGIRYGSEESIAFIDRVYRLIRDAAYRASVDLAAEKGAFPRYDRDQYDKGEFIQALPSTVRDEIFTHGIRNAVLLSQAPTGTTSLVAGVSSGIEPVFAFSTKRVDRMGESYHYHPLMKDWIQANQDPDDGIVYQDPPAYFVTTHDLTPEEHIRVQAAVQKYTDSSISKTVNGPNDHTVKDVMDLYMLAFDSGCKGVTYYRDGSRDAVLTVVEEKKGNVRDHDNDDDQEGPATLPVGAEGAAEGRAGRAGVGADQATLPGVATFRHRPTVLPGYTREIATPVGDAHVTINSDKDGPLEVFVVIGRAGSDLTADSEALGRLISAALRLPSPLAPIDRLELLAEQLTDIGGRQSVGFGKNRVRSLADGIGQVLAEHVQNERDAADAMEEETPANETVDALTAFVRVMDPVVRPEDGDRLGRALAASRGQLCPECGEMTLRREEGCEKCECGYSAC